MKISRTLLFLALVYSGGLMAAPTFRAMDQLPGELSFPGKVGEFGAGETRETLSFPAAQFLPLEKNEWQLSMPGGKVVSAERMPELPTYLKRIPIPAGQTVRIGLENLRVEESTEAVAVHKSPQVYVWSPSHALDIPEQYARYYPGKFLQVSEADNVANVTLFPVQYDQQTGKVLVLRSAEITVEYETTSELTFPVARRWGSEGLIVTSQRLLPSAKRLQAFHANKLGIQSEIVTVEDIDKVESPVAEVELPEGYKEVDGRDFSVVPYDPATKTGYNYPLALKLIQYLQKRMAANSGTRYVTLVGGANDVPPSYYITIEQGFSKKYVPTDQCYAARKQCLEPKLALGRLPLTSDDEMTNYLDKATSWLAYSVQSKSEVALFGGKAFPVDTYIGELGALRVANSEKANWRGLQKFFRTKKNYNKSAVLDLVKGKNTASFVYYLDHGNGNQWWVEKSYVSAQEVLDLPKMPSGNTPVIVSIACTNAAFDEDLAKDEIFGAESNGKYSVGVALLKSKAGAVAYVGSLRPAMGAPLYNFDKSGNLNMTGANYGLQLMDTFYAKYQSAGGGRLGDSVLKALQAYVGENGNDMSTDRNRYTYFIVSLLGDPALTLPTRQEVERGYALAKSTTTFQGIGPNGVPKFLLGDTALSLKLETSAPVVGTLIRLFGPYSATEEIVETKALPSGASDYTLPEKALREAGQYFLRLENQQGVPLERQVWFRVDQARDNNLRFLPGRAKPMGPELPMPRVKNAG